MENIFRMNDSAYRVFFLVNWQNRCTWAPPSPNSIDIFL